MGILIDSLVSFVQLFITAFLLLCMIVIAVGTFSLGMVTQIINYLLSYRKNGNL